MLPIPPLASAAFAATLVQRQSEEKAEQMRRVCDHTQDALGSTDEYVHSVESTEKVQPIHEEAPKRDSRPGKRRQPANPDATQDGEQPRLDLTA